MMRFLRELSSPFVWKLAFRDAKPQWRTLLLYTSSVIAGVAALVAILSFRSDVLLTVQAQSKELLGADLELRSGDPFPEPVEAFIDSVSGADATALEFSSMVIFDDEGRSRLSQIRAIDGPFPFYGELETLPAEAALTYQQSGSALLEQSAMQQYGVQIGDTIQVGNQRIPVAGELISVPGEAAAFSLIGPRVYLPQRVIEESGLLDRGSRVTYKSFFQIEEPEELASITEAFRPLGREHRVRTETVASRQEDFDEIVSNLSRFLGLIGFIALLLGGLGVAGAIFVYIKRKSSTVAVLRCIGVSKEQILATFSIQVAGIGIAGALAGTLIGLLLQFYLPTLFSGLLPFDIVQQLSVPSILLGLLTGLGISITFSLLPLAALSSISPMLTLRTIEFSPVAAISKKKRAITLFISLSLLIGIVTLLTESWAASFAFTGGLFLAIFLLWVISNGLTRLVRSLKLNSLPYPLRQGMANLFRPNNQTTLLITTLGMGMLLIGTLYLSQDMLVKRIDLETGENFPDLVFYDIQYDQNVRVNELASAGGNRVIQNVPIVSMRLTSRNGMTLQEIREDSTLDISRWALSREYRVTYRDTLTSSETVLEGEWTPEAEGIGSLIPISLDTNIQEDLQLSVGDTLGFNVQGVPITTIVGSIREVDFQRPEPNFFVLFPTGVLEAAPQFYATTVKAGGEEQLMNLQQQVALEFPNISAIDVSVALESIQEFLGKIAVAIQFMALFSILTGLIVLGSSIAISRKQRTRESVILRTLGARKPQISIIQTVEYALIGLLSSLAGLLFSGVASWLLARYFFEMEFLPDFLYLTGLTGLVILATIGIGWSGSRHIFKASPIEILRSESV